jgi:hypothetical protein
MGAAAASDRESGLGPQFDPGAADGGGREMTEAEMAMHGGTAVVVSEPDTAPPAPPQPGTQETAPASPEAPQAPAESTAEPGPQRSRPATPTDSRSGRTRSTPSVTASWSATSTVRSPPAPTRPPGGPSRRFSAMTRARAHQRRRGRQPAGQYGARRHAHRARPGVDRRAAADAVRPLFPAPLGVVPSTSGNGVVGHLRIRRPCSMSRPAVLVWTSTIRGGARPDLSHAAWSGHQPSRSMSGTGGGHRQRHVPGVGHSRGYGAGS